MAASELSPDSVLAKSGQYKELTNKEYSFLIRSLDNNLIKKDLKLLKFLCADFFDDKKFLAKEDVTAYDIFSQLKRNGTISNENLTLLSQLMLLLGKKNLQRDILLPHKIIWEEGIETSLSEFRYMLFRLYQSSGREDFEKMTQYCSLRLDAELPRSELERVTNALELFTVLIDNAVISTEDVNFLWDAVGTLGSKRMLQMVTGYKETLSSRESEQQPERNNQLSEVSSNIAHPIPSLPRQFSAGGSGHVPPYSRLSSTGTCYMDERVAGTSLLRPSDLFTGNELSSEKSSLFSAVQPAEPLAIGGKGQLNSTTAKTAEIEDKLKGIHIPSIGEEQGSSRPNGTVTVTSDPDKNQQSENLDVFSPGQHHKDTKPHTEGCEKDKDESIFSSNFSLMKGLEFPSTSSDEKGDDSERYFEGATGGQSNPLVSKTDENGASSESAFPSRELLQTMDPAKVNLTARTEAEETELKKLKETVSGSATADRNSRDSTCNTLPSVHHPPPWEAYEMTRNPRGKCLLLTYKTFDDTEHIKERHGNEKDVEALIPLFEDKLLFDVEEHLDLSYKETKRVIRRIAKEDHSKYDCFVLIICSHGNENSVFTKDTRVTEIMNSEDPKDITKKFSDVLDIQEDLLTPFKAGKCKSLAGKPKIFFINSCRREGELFEAFVEVDRDGTISADGYTPGVASNMKLVPNEADFCVVLSTIPGYSSARRRDKGTIFVEVLAHCMEEHYEELDLLRILTRVNYEMEEFMQKIRAIKNEQMVTQNCPALTTLKKAVYFSMLPHRKIVMPR